MFYWNRAARAERFKVSPCDQGQRQIHGDETGLKQARTAEFGSEGQPVKYNKLKARLESNWNIDQRG